jgi:hypothetical protein
MVEYVFRSDIIVADLVLVEGGDCICDIKDKLVKLLLNPLPLLLPSIFDNLCQICRHSVKLHNLRILGLYFDGATLYEVVIGHLEQIFALYIGHLLVYENFTCDIAKDLTVII